MSSSEQARGVECSAQFSWGGRRRPMWGVAFERGMRLESAMLQGAGGNALQVLESK